MGRSRPLNSTIEPNVPGLLDVPDARSKQLSSTAMLNATVLALDPTGVSRARIRLDTAEQRFLADHRLGQRAILSTVMSLEAMAEAAILVRPHTSFRSVENLVKRLPVFVADGAPQLIEVEVEPAPNDALRCRIVSDPDGSRVLHDEAVLHLAASFPGPPAGTAPITADDAPTVLQEQIYRLYFHGRSFQVIASAALAPGCLIATLAASLPPIADTASAAAPLLIELCLQGAGLLELESTGRMMIPSSLDSVIRYSDLDSDSGGALRAVVRRRPGAGVADDAAAPQDDAVFDADVLDDVGRTHLEVRGYRTAPIDQPVDEAAASAVVAALRG